MGEDRKEEYRKRRSELKQEGWTFYRKENYIDCSLLPKYIYKQKEVIDWEKCDHHVAKCLYQGELYTVYITFYHRIDMQTKVMVSKDIEDKENIIINVSQVRTVYIGSLFEHKKKYKLNIGEVIKGMRVIEQNDFQGKGYLVQCLTTGVKFNINENNLISNVQKSRFINSLYNLEWIHQYVVDKEDLYKYRQGSTSKINFICPICQTITKRLINYTVQQGFRCSQCDPRISYPERFMLALLNLNNIYCIRQHMFEDLRNRRFDFYLPDLNVVIETHGKQHYTKKDFYGSEKVFEADEEKKKYCRENNIKYIEVNCSYSDGRWIYKRLPEFIHNLNSYSLEEIMERAMSQPMLRIKEDFDKGMSFEELSNKYGINKTTIRVKLRECGVYKPPNWRKGVECLNNGKQFNSLVEASKYAGFKSVNSVRKCCYGEREFAGYDEETGEPLRWKFIKEEDGLIG